jgi:hypothetical protein
MGSSCVARSDGRIGTFQRYRGRPCFCHLSFSSCMHVLSSEGSAADESSEPGPLDDQARLHSVNRE